jgi:hypothetical protein
LNRTKEEISKFRSCAWHAAEAGEVGMHASEMSRCLMFLGITDSAQHAVCLDRHGAQSRTSECDSG